MDFSHQLCCADQYQLLFLSMGNPIPLSSTSQLLTQLNKADFLGPLQGVSAPPSLTVPILPQQESAQLYGDLWKLAYKFGTRINQAAVIFVAAALVASLVQQHGPKASIWIRENTSKFLFLLAMRLKVRNKPAIDVPFINIKL